MAVGTVAAHGIMLAVTPMLTRLFDPSAFGVLAIYMAVVGLVGVVACFGFEAAIVLADDDRDASILLGLCLSSAFVWAALAGVVIALFGDVLIGLAHASALGTVLWLIPLAIFLRGAYQALMYRATRAERMGHI
ncbi:MAG: oligosaccharide flippase family protein, partial [Rhodospirillales bacterium]|nr:oligosaccharide flippase family protein [Rhodospirillales bacterium]